MAMPFPEFTQCLQSQIRQWHDTILVAFAPADMNLFFTPCIDITALKRQCLFKANFHGIGGQ
jgi:hypothetical protein